MPSGQVTTAVMSGFTSSEEELEDPEGRLLGRPPPTPPLRLDFVDLTAYGLPPHCLAMSSLPGCKFR